MDLCFRRNSSAFVCRWRDTLQESISSVFIKRYDAILEDGDLSRRRSSKSRPEARDMDMLPWAFILVAVTDRLRVRCLFCEGDV